MSRLIVGFESLIRSYIDLLPLLNKWGYYKDSDAVARLLGFANFQTMWETADHEETNRLIQQLLGPNGYTIYKTLLIQRGVPYLLDGNK